MERHGAGEFILVINFSPLTSSQVIWTQDFPREEEQERSPFKEDLLRIFHSLTLYDDVADLSSHPLSLLPFDFSSSTVSFLIIYHYDLLIHIKQVHLIASVPGIYRGDQMALYGHLRLRSVLANHPITLRGALLYHVTSFFHHDPFTPN